jgi:hypothetical protein
LRLEGLSEELDLGTNKPQQRNFQCPVKHVKLRADYPNPPSLRL